MSFCFTKEKVNLLSEEKSHVAKEKKTIMPGVLPGADTIFTTTDDENHAACMPQIDP